MTVNTPWTIGNGEIVILIVEGTVTIDAPIRLSPVDGSGFITIIASDGITVTSNVGTAPSSTVSQLDGVYMTCGTFATGSAAPVSGEERFVGRGMFLAENFALQRDLGEVNNPLYAANVFQYHPTFLITMPDAMREIQIKWEESKPRTVN